MARVRLLALSVKASSYATYSTCTITISIQNLLQCILNDYLPIIRFLKRVAKLYEAVKVLEDISKTCNTGAVWRQAVRIHFALSLASNRNTQPRRMDRNSSFYRT